MELINIENLIILDDANIVKNIKFARNLLKKHNNQHILFISNEIWQYVDKYMDKYMYKYMDKYMDNRKIRLININNFIISQIVIDDINILNSNEIMVISKHYDNNTEKKIKRYLILKRIEVGI